MGKLIQPEDIAETILFLASEQARMLTGQVIKDMPYDSSEIHNNS